MFCSFYILANKFSQAQKPLVLYCLYKLVSLYTPVLKPPNISEEMWQPLVSGLSVSIL